ncbi:MAG: valine--tRNA ligase [Bacteroidota bacterium]
MPISTKYQPAEIEEKWYQEWIKHQAFKSVPDDRPPYTITIPPPNVTGVLHMGHILNNTIQDVLIRRKRMQGFNACWVPGTDHASIATEAKVVKMLREKGIGKRDLSREAFLAHAFEWKEKYGGIILEQLKKMGASCDWDRTSFTMDPEYSESVIQVFCDLFDKGYIYRGYRMVNWDPEAQTAVSDEEVIHKETQGKLYYVRYAIEGESGTFVTIATTRPETILGDTAIAVHPEDERYLHLKGKKAIVPLINRAIPIIQDDYLDPEFGTGCLKVTPAHDTNDYEIGQRHKLESIDIFNPNGTVSEAGQLYIGQDRFVVRKQIVRDLEVAGHLVKTEDYTNSVGYSERTDAVIEPRLSLQWFLKMKELSQPALDAVLEGRVNLIPGKFINTYRHWMENVKDWCLSRQLWWGHQIPAYYIKGDEDNYVVGRTTEEALQKAIEKTGDTSLTAKDLIQDEDVLDTWGSSWLWPISVFNGLTDPDNEEINYYYPTNDLVTAPEILFFWVARMVIAGLEYMDEVPFKNVYLTGIVRDEKGRKMSKSLGNSPDVFRMMELYGADGVRVGVLLTSPAGNDLKFDTPLVLPPGAEPESKLCEQGRNFANKLWNATRLVKGWEADPNGTISTVERQAIEWMESRLAEAAAELEGQFDKFRISEALMTVYKLAWDDFCSWFLEMMKPARNTQISTEALEAVISCYERLLQFVHPFMPFVTEEIWQLLRDRSPGEFLCTDQMPEMGAPDSNVLKEVELIKVTISALRKFRLEKQIPNKEAIDLFIKQGSSTTVFEAYSDMLGKFLNTSSITLVDEQPEGSGSLRVGKHEFFVPVEVDVEAERAKILQDIDYLQGFLTKVDKKLSNERFVQNAPEAVVAKEHQKKADTEAKLKVLHDNLSRIS